MRSRPVTAFAGGSLFWFHKRGGRRRASLPGARYERGVVDMLQWLLFETELGDRLLAWLERRCGLVVTPAWHVVASDGWDVRSQRFHSTTHSTK